MTVTATIPGTGNQPRGDTEEHAQLPGGLGAAPRYPYGPPASLTSDPARMAEFTAIVAAEAARALATAGGSR